MMNVFQLVHRAGAWPARVAATAARAGTGWRGPIAGRSHRESRNLLFQFGGLAGWADRHRRALDDSLEPMAAFLTDVFKDRHAFYSPVDVTDGIISGLAPDCNEDLEQSDKLP